MVKKVQESMRNGEVYQHGAHVEWVIHGIFFCGLSTGEVLRRTGRNLRTASNPSNNKTRFPPDTNHHNNS